MDLDQFIEKYTDKGIDFDGHFGNQCMDLYRQYVAEVLNYPQSKPVPSAKDVWDTYLPKYFDRVENKPTNIPLKGDIVIWGKEFGKHGHISVFVEGGVRTFKSFDQNSPLKSLSHVQKHNYKGVLGWLRPRKDMSTDIKWLIDYMREKGIDPLNEGAARGQLQVIFDGNEKYKEKQKRIDSLENELAGAKGEAAECETRLSTFEKNRGESQEEVDKLNKQLHQNGGELVRLNNIIVKQETEIEGLRQKRNDTPPVSDNKFARLIRWLLRRKVGD